MKSPVLFTREDFDRWVKTIKFAVPPYLQLSKPWLTCVAVVVPGEMGCADLVFVYYHEFQSARYVLTD